VVAAVAHQEIPSVPLSARETIHGRIKVAVRVTVDASGTVVGQTIADPGSSKYFARLAAEAAGKWKFPPVTSRDPRTWLLTFEFTRSGTTARSAPR
jgi:TonB family protein